MIFNLFLKLWLYFHTQETQEKYEPIILYENTSSI